MIGGVALSLAYGLNIERENDPYITLSERAIASLGEAAVPGKFLVDSLPFLKHLPEFFPGAGFKKKAAEWRKLQSMFREEPFAATVDNIVRLMFSLGKFSILTPKGTRRRVLHGHHLRRCVLICLMKLKIRSISEKSSKMWQLFSLRVTESHPRLEDWAAYYSCVAAGSDTTISAIHTFFLAMLAYPDVQDKVHQELDEIVGRGRLPDFSDEQRMPYLNAVIKEVLRYVG